MESLLWKKKIEKINLRFNLVSEDTDWSLNTECQSSPDPLAHQIAPSDMGFSVGFISRILDRHLKAPLH